MKWPECTCSTVTDKQVRTPGAARMDLPSSAGILGRFTCSRIAHGSSSGHRRPSPVTVVYIGVALLAGGLVWGSLVFNRLVRLRNQVRTAWADIDVQLLRRHDLVPQLVVAVQAYADHERATLEAVTSLRAQAMDTRDASTLARLEDALESGIRRLVALQEAYPQLAASTAFLKLQSDLVDVETQLQYARRFYNGAVRDLNDAVQRVPDVVVARVCGVGAAAFFEADDDSRRPVAVELSR